MNRTTPSLRPALWIVAALGVLSPAPASAAVTIGSDLTAPATVGFGCEDGCTVSHDVGSWARQAPGGPAAPDDGVVVRWRIKVGVQTAPAALRITRPGNSVARTGAGTGSTVTPAAGGTSVFDARLPIRAGDTIGIDCCPELGAGMFAFASSPETDVTYWNPRLSDGGPTRSGAQFGAELLVNADIEPDRDGDGFGDETQDGCPGDPLAQTDCIPPETRITQGAPGKTRRLRVRYRFASDEPDSSFECRLKGKGLRKSAKRFGDCAPPRRYKRLDPGGYRFQVRAIDAAGNVDPTPAKDRFRVVP